jgi:hypothetical protein
MPGKDNFDIARLERLLESIVRKYGVSRATPPLLSLSGFMVLGGPYDLPSARRQLPGAFTRFLRDDKSLQGPMSEMALRLFGATTATHGQTIMFREGEVGKVQWKGRTVGVEAVRRKPGGRRWEIIERVAEALYDAEVEVRRAHQTNS